jgi:hypothetical protein
MLLRARMETRAARLVARKRRQQMQRLGFLIPHAWARATFADIRRRARRSAYRQYPLDHVTDSDLIEGINATAIEFGSQGLGVQPATAGERNLGSAFQVLLRPY